ncbi:MAG TPA: acyltransferase [Edaphobacter sp.]|jgi:peptidoglycan/LPS O-acetylase OafA/YrhL|nr:acyltransferase [Edaphobacter sp.]
MCARPGLTSSGIDRPAEKHILALDGIRGLAILFVLYHHLFWSNPNSGNPIFDFLNAIRASAFIGVNLFFALSGFLITGILLDTVNSPNFFKTFYVRRMLRIFPLYYGLLITLLLLTRPLHFVWNGWQYFYLTYSTNFALWPRGPLVLQPFSIDHLWSLQVEEQFYLVWPLILYRVRSLRSLIRISILVCVATLLIRIVLVAERSYLNNVYLPYSSTFSCVDNLLFGCCLCALLRTTLRQQVLHFAPRIFALCVMVLTVAAIPNHGLDWKTSIFIPTFGFSLIGISCAALIAMSLEPGSRTKQFFSHPILRFFGKYSYGLYVFHYPLGCLLNQPVRNYIDAHFHRKVLGVIAGAIVVFIATTLAALLSYHFYEAPFLKLKKHFTYRKSAATADRQTALHTA